MMRTLRWLYRFLAARVKMPLRGRDARNTYPLA